MGSAWLGAVLVLLGSLAAAGRASTHGPASPRAHSGSPSLRLENVWATKGERGVLEFGAVTGMAAAPGGDVWISDGINDVVAAVRSGGGDLRIVARRGEGPGEVRGPALLAPVAGEGIAVLDLVGDRVHFFSPGARFVRSVPVHGGLVNPKGMVVRGGRVIVSGGMPGNPSAIHQFGPDGGLEHSWHPAPRTENPRAGAMVAGGALSLDRRGGLLFSQAAPHRIVRFPPEGGAGRELAADPALLRPVGDDFIYEAEGRRRFRWGFPQSRGIFERPDGTLLNVVRFEDEGYTLWKVYRPDGTLVVRQRVARAYEPWAMTANGDVLASYADPETDEPVAVRLRLTLR